MKIAVADMPKLRIAQAATNSNYRREAGHNALDHVIRIEPGGRAVATNQVAIVVAEDVVTPFEGEPVYIIPEKRILKGAKYGEIDLDAGILSSDKRDENPILVAHVSQDGMGRPGGVSIRPYFNYQAVLDRLTESPEHARADYSVNVKQLYELAAAHPDWPGGAAFRFRHLSDRSIALENGMDGITILVKMLDRGDA